MCSGSEAGSYLRLIDFCVSLNSRLASYKEDEDLTVSAHPAGNKMGYASGHAPAHGSHGGAHVAQVRPPLLPERESSLLTTYWPESTLSS